MGLVIFLLDFTSLLTFVKSIFMEKTGITREQAIKKMGKYAALTAIGTFAILNPKKAQASSSPPDPWWGD